MALNATITPPRMEQWHDVKRLVMVGACYVDTILSVPHFLQEDAKLRAESLDKRRGGNVANSLEVLQQLLQHAGSGIELVLICVLPAQSSLATKFIAESMPNVDLSHCIYRQDHEEPASSYIIKNASNASRTIVNYNDLPEMTVEEFQHQVASLGDLNDTWFHFEGREIDASVTCMQWLKKCYTGVVISAEVEKPAREGLERMAAEATVVFFSRSWAEAQGYRDAVDLLKSQVNQVQDAKLLYCTWGEAGAAVAHVSTGATYHDRAEAEHGRTIIDTIGAGDTFIAAVLFKLLVLDTCTIDTWTRAKAALTYGTETATKKVYQHGFSNLAV